MTGEDPGAPATEVDRSDHHKHMDYVQAVITRLANNSVLLKGWALTLSSAVLGFAITQKHAGLALAALVPVTAFWLLDTYYLRQERAFRDMYTDIAAKRVRDFKIEPKLYAGRQAWWRVAFSVSLAVYYGAITMLTVVVAIILAVVTAMSTQNSEPESLKNSPSEQPPPGSTLNPSSPIPPPTAPPRPDELPLSPHFVEPPAMPEPRVQETSTSPHQ
ncbi:hypothetical protein BH09ACT8_BH09ACT8_19610 [soil metagenome]